MYAIMAWYVSPLAAAIAGSVAPALLLVRALHAALWICEWRLNLLWRKMK